MARVRSTVRVAHEGEQDGASGTTPISEMMKHSGLVVREEKESVPIEVLLPKLNQLLPKLIVITKMMMAF
jgi:hypothetical protein